jgi:CubicO group peptidase (beta-lactamase class C family)
LFVLVSVESSQPNAIRSGTVTVSPYNLRKMTAPPSITFRRLALKALGMCLLATVCHARDRANPKVDKLFAPWDRADSPGAAVVVVKDGAVVYQHGYGYANLEHRIPITPQTSFDVASVAKQFTGLAVAMLIQQGKLSLDDDIRKHLPDVPDFGKPITISNLLHHTSGLRDWPETLSLSDMDMEGPISLDVILEMVRRQRELDFAPGEDFSYSNTGYNLLAAAVAKVTGQSFRAWCEANLFRPLGMKHTQVCDNSAEVVPDRADCYSPGEKGKFRRVNSQLSAQGSSSLFITAEDMGKWLLNFETALVGGRTALEMMRQPGKLKGGAVVRYGFGLDLGFGPDSGKFHGSPMIRHGGSWAGYRSFVIYIPEKRFGVAVLSNTGDMNEAGLAVKVADLYLGNSPAKRSDPPSKETPVKSDPAIDAPKLKLPELTPDHLAAYVGDYWSEELRVAGRIEIQDGKLASRQRSGNWVYLTPTGTDRFDADGGWVLEFTRNPASEITGLRMSGGRVRKIRYTRVTLPQPALP